MAGFITKESIDAVRRAIDIAALIGEYVPLTQRGESWWGCCPFHSEKTPSFCVTPGRFMFYCFGCHKGGDPFTFVMEMEKITYPEAVAQLARRAGIALRYEDGRTPTPKTHNDAGEELLALYDRVASMFHYLLTQTSGGKFALDYATSRGLTAETIAKFRLGYAPADRHWLKGFLRSKHFSDAFLAHSGLFSKKYPDVAFFSDRLMFPILDRHGRAVAFGGRLLRGEGPKYLNSGDMAQYRKGETLYAFHLARAAVREARAVIFCEGYMDCIAYHQCGIRNAVAPLGTALTEEQVRLVKPFVDTVFLSFDSDSAGQAATRRAILLCRQQGLTVRVIRLRGGKDPAEIMLHYGAKVLTEDVHSAIIDSDYLFEVLSQTFRVDTPDGKTKAALEFFPYVDALQTDIQKESCLEQLGQRFSISSEAVHRDFASREQARQRANARQERQRGRQVQEVRLSAQLRAVLAVVADVDQFAVMRSELTEDDFDDTLAKELFMILEECYRAGDLSLNAIVQHCKDESIRQRILESVSSGEFSQHTVQTVHDSIELIRRASLVRRRDALLNRIRLLNPVTLEDQQQLRLLLEQKHEIDHTLRKKD